MSIIKYAFGASSASTPNQATTTDVDATYRKVTVRLITFLFVCWVLNYIDRVNVSFAQLQLAQDLGLSDVAYGIGVSVFFIGYILCELPSTLLMKRIPSYLSGDAAAGGIAVISSLGQVGAFLAPVMLGWVKNLTGSFAAGLLVVAVLVFLGGILVLFCAPRPLPANSR